MGKKGDVSINDQLCKGCGLCAYFCPNGCILIQNDRVSSKGFVLPLFAEPEKCNACGNCGKLCPELAIEVVKIA